jgi:hypothetical protein
MEIIEFQCPNCRKVVGFDRKLISKTAHCDKCSQKFVVPSEDFAQAKKIASTCKTADSPGFYKDLFVNNWKAFFKEESLVGIIFIAAIVFFKFFLGHIDYSTSFRYIRLQAPVGTIVSVAGWGCLLWYYMEIIYSAAFGDNYLPEVNMGGIFGAAWKIIKSISAFAFVLLIVEAPFLLIIAVLKNLGISSGLITEILTLAGAYFFPIIILTISVGQSEDLFKPLKLISSIFRNFTAYSVLSIMFLAIWLLEFETIGYHQAAQTDTGITLHLVANLTVQFTAVFIMRGIGLFYKHYRD